MVASVWEAVQVVSVFVLALLACSCWAVDSNLSKAGKIVLTCLCCPFVFLQRLAPISQQSQTVNFTWAKMAVKAFIVGCKMLTVLIIISWWEHARASHGRYTTSTVELQTRLVCNSTITHSLCKLCKLTLENPVRKHVLWHFSGHATTPLPTVQICAWHSWSIAPRAI